MRVSEDHPHRAVPRTTANATTAAALLAVATLAGCGGEAPGTIEPLPPLPRVDIARFEPAVREQVGARWTRLEAAPRDPDANGRVAMLLHAYGWLDAAAICYLRAARLDPRSHRWWHLHGHIESERGRPREAREAMRHAHERDKGSLATLLALGQLALELDEPREAESWLSLARALAPRSAHVLAALADVRVRRSSLDDAARLFEEALGLEPGLAKARHGLALAHRRRGDVEGVAKALAVDPATAPVTQAPDPLLDEVRGLRRDAEHLLRQAASRFERGDTAAALAIYRDILRRNPASDLALYNVARCLQTGGRHTEAVSRYEELLGRRPRHVDALNNLGLSLLELGRLEDAVERFTGAVALDSRYHRAHLNLALTLERRGDVDAAIVSCRAALSARADHAESSWTLGRLLLRSGDAAGAVEQLVETLRLDPADTRAHDELLRLRGAHAPATAGDHRKLAAFLAGRSCVEGSIEALRRGLELEEGWRNAVALAWLLVTASDRRLRDPVRALALVEPVCEAPPPPPRTALDTLALVYAGLGRLDEAIDTATRALRRAQEVGSSPAAAGLAERIARRLASYRSRRAGDER